MALEFFLTYRGVRVQASEPALEWEEIAKILDRSERYDGITYLVTSELRFANNFVNILDQVKANGIGDQPILEIFRKDNQTREFVNVFIGKVDLVGSKKTIDVTGREEYTINTNPTGFEVDFDNNFDVEVNVTSNTDLFGNAIAPFSKTFEYILCKPLSIKKRLQLGNQIPNNFDGGSEIQIDARPDNYLFFWTMFFGDKTFQEFGDEFQDNPTLQYDDFTYQPDLSITDLQAITDAPHSPINSALYILRAATAGTYDLIFDYNLSMDIDLVASNEQILQYRYVMLAAIVDRKDPLNPSVALDIINSDIVENHDNSKLQFTKSGSLSKNYTLALNQEVYLFPYMLLRVFNTQVAANKVSINKYKIEFNSLNLSINGITKFGETSVQAYMIHELFSRLVNKITGQFNAFQSDFYGRTDSEPRTYSEDGEGSLTAIMSGLHLRGWQVGNEGDNQRSLNLSFAELFESESAKHNLGVGIIDGIVRVEKKEFFVDKVNTSANLGCIRSMEIETESKLFYNEVEIGFSEWKNSENKSGAGLQEFNTKVNYAPQLSALNNKYLAVSKFIAGGYPIETTRREQRSLDAEKETDKDLKKFMIALLRRSGDGSESNPNFVNETYIDGDSSNPWQSVTGVDFPEEVYNVRWHPARLVRNHGNQIRLSVKQNSNDTLLIEPSEGNTNFASQLKTEASPIQEGVNIPGSDLGDNLYTGNKFIYNVGLTDAQIAAIEANPYYNVEFSDAKGNDYKAIITEELSINLESNLADFNLLEIFKPE